VDFISDFKDELLNQYTKNPNTTDYTLAEWFSFSQNLWGNIDRFQNLFNYVNIEELQQDKQISIIIEKLSDTFKSSIGEGKIKEICDNAIKNFEVNNFNHILSSVLMRIDNESSTLSDIYNESFEKDCKERHISHDLFTKRKILLSKKFIMIIEDWKQNAIVLLNETRVKYSKAGDDLVNKEINRRMTENKNMPFSKEAALDKFNEFWDNVVELPLLRNTKCFLDLSDEMFSMLKKSYEACTTQLTHDVDIERNLRGYINNFDLNTIHQVFNNNKSSLVYFKTQSNTDMEELMKVNNMKGKYLIQLVNM